MLVRKAAYGFGKIKDIKGVRITPATQEDLEEIDLEVSNYRPFNNRKIVEGGLFDIRLKENWGYISLPLDVINPVLLHNIAKVFKTKVGDLLSSKRYKVFLVEDSGGEIEISNQRYRGVLVFEDDQGNYNETPGLFMGYRIKGIIEVIKLATIIDGLDFSPKKALLNRWPVIPWIYRPFSDYGWGYVLHNLNLLYIRLLMLITRIKKLQEAKEWEEVPAVYTLIQKAVYEIVFGGNSYRHSNIPGTLGVLSGKDGLVRQRLLGQRIDYSGRAVIVPAPDLKIDEVYLPKKIALDVLRPHIIKNLRRSEPNSKITKPLLEEWLFSVEGTPVILNRQPTLHKYSLLAFRAKFWNKDVIGLHPLVVEPFNADMDGDTMAVWTAISEEGMRDIEERILVTKNLQLADGRVFAVPRHDYLHGLWRLTKDNPSRGRPIKLTGAESIEELETLIDNKYGPAKNTSLGQTLGRVLVSKVVGQEVTQPITKYSIKHYTQPLDKYLASVDTLKRLGSKYGNDPFSLRDLWQLLPEKEPESIEEIDAGLETLRKIDNPAVNMIKSGSRGSWSQLRQMVISKGFVRSPKGLEFIKTPLIKGLSSEEYWEALHGSRASLVDKVVTIADPGYLARRLSLAVSDQIIVKNDCGDTEGIVLDKEFTQGLEVLEDLGDKARVRTPFTCKVDGPGVCSKCAGNLEIGTYLGILAATTLSEPTTQLTLRVFHTGGEVGNIPVIAPVSGTITNITNQEILIDDYIVYLPSGYIPQVSIGDTINKDDVLAVRVSSIGVTQDFKDLEALYELRSTGGIVSTTSGKLSLKIGTNKITLTVGEESYRVPKDRRILKAGGQQVEKLDWLVDGVPDYKKLYSKIGHEAVALWLSQVQNIYKRSGISISPRDLLAIARAMLVDNGWKGVKASMNSKKDAILRLGAEGVTRLFLTGPVELNFESEASQALVKIPPYGSGFREEQDV